MQKIKWDGISELEKIKSALLGFITDEEKQQAKKTAYGYFTDIIRKNHRNSATNNGGYITSGFFDKVTVSVGEIEYCMTWNKAAKYISQWLNQEENIMENQVIITENYNRAVSLHRRICANAQAAQESLFEVCKGLKEMRDGKLYKELGYQNFEDYTQTELGFSRQNAYNYIAVAEKFSEDFVNSSLQIGMKKLSLLAKLDEPERQEIIQNTDLESTSVKQLKDKISDLKKANDRLLEKVNQAEKNAEDSRKKETDAWGKVSVLKTDSEMQIKKISQLEKQIQELEKNPKQVAVEDTTKINELKEEIKKLKADSASEIDSMKTRHDTEKADFMRQKNELKKQLEEIEKDRQDWIDTNRENVELTRQISSLERQIEELENRPVEVAVKDNSEEIENLKNQLEQERQKFKSEIEKAKSESKKIPDNSEIFEIYYQNCIDSIEKLFAFLRNKNLKSFNKRLYELSDILNDNISMLDEY